MRKEQVITTTNNNQMEETKNKFMAWSKKVKNIECSFYREEEKVNAFISKKPNKY